MAQLEFKCERCGKLLKVDAQPGQMVTCSHCQSQVAAPRVGNGGPRPSPQVMGGARPQPMAAAGAAAGSVAVGAGAQEPVVVEEVEDDSVLAAMAVLMPWALSIVFHVGLLLAALFVNFLVQQAPDEGDVIVPDSRWVQDPGSQVLTKNEKVEQYNKTKSKSDITKPAPDVLDKSQGQPDKNIMIAVPGSNSSSGGTGALSELFAGGESGGGAKFFGTQSGGNVTRLAYVVDMSGSMFENFPYVKAELARSINELQPHQQFTVIFFADKTPYPLSIGGKTGLHYATPRNKRAAKEWIDDKSAGSKGGSTDPSEALKRAFATGQVQLVYLLTDGIFPREALDVIRQNRRNAKVNTIAFKDRVGEKLMQDIAKETGGVYRFISEEDLGTEY